MAIKPYLQLIRLPNVFTAAADSLAGWLLVMGTFHEPSRWLPLVFASALTYAGGIVLNDLFDYQVDKIERPERPLPSGQIGRSFAAKLGLALLGGGLVLAIASRTSFGWLIELLLIGCVVTYDAGLKHSVLGPEVMGACRALNLLLGMSHAAWFGGPAMLLIAASYGLFVTGITWISRSEVHVNLRENIAIGLILQVTAFLGLIIGCIAAGSTMRIWGVLALLVLGFRVADRSTRAFRHPNPWPIQRAIKFAIMSLVWIHVGVLLGVRGWIPALVVALFWIPAAFVGRWIYST